MRLSRPSRDGFRAEWTDDNGDNGDNGDKRIETLSYLDLTDPHSNDLLAVQQMWVKGNLHSRRLDVALFVNGVPLVLMEFKEPNEPIKSAYDANLTDYRDTIPQLFIPNCFVLLSNGSEAKVGSTYSPWEFFSDWKVIDADGTRGAVALETALRGTCEPAILLDLFENFVAYMERPGGLIKVAARSH
ncbi:MAG: type I restriction endonuclease, partial [Gemmatimonadales bacterium]